MQPHQPTYGQQPYPVDHFVGAVLPDMRPAALVAFRRATFHDRFTNPIRETGLRLGTRGLINQDIAESGFQLVIEPVVDSARAHTSAGSDLSHVNQAQALVHDLDFCLDRDYSVGQGTPLCCVFGKHYTTADGSVFKYLSLLHSLVNHPEVS